MSYEATSLGFDLKFEGPASVEEYDQKAGKPGACLEDAVMNTIYRSTLPDWQERFAKKVEDLTGEKRAENADATAKSQARTNGAAAKKGVEPAKVKPVLETVKTYVGRVTAPFADDAEMTAKLKSLADEAATEVSVDPSPSARTAAINKGDLAKADELLTLDDEAFATKLAKIETVDAASALLEVDPETSRPSRESLAKAIGVWLKAML